MTSAGKKETGIRVGQVLQYGIPAVFSIGFLYLAVRGTNTSELLNSLAGVNYWWILLVVALVLMSAVFRAYRWGFMLLPIKDRPRMRSLVSSVMIGYLANNVLPRAGEVTKSYTLAKLEGIPVAAVFGTAVAERLLDMLTLFLCLFAVPLVYNGPLAQVFPWLHQVALVGLAVATAVVAGIVALVLKRDTALRIIDAVSRWGWLPKSLGAVIRRVSRSFLDGLEFIRRRDVAFPMLLLSALIWGIYVLMIYASIRGFGLQDSIGLDASFVVMTIATIGVAIPTPGGTGTYHFFVTAVLTGLYGITRDTAVSFAAVTHASVYIGTCVSGLVFLFLDQKRIIVSSLRGLMQPQLTVHQTPEI